MLIPPSCSAVVALKVGAVAVPEKVGGASEFACCTTGRRNHPGVGAVVGVVAEVDVVRLQSSVFVIATILR